MDTEIEECREIVSSNIESVPKDHDSAVSNHYYIYKNNRRTAELSLQQRREVFLNELKEKHNVMYDHRRDLSNLFEEYNDEREEEPMELDRVFHKTSRTKIKFRMTMSEWFTEIPDDLAEKWLVKFCPAGKRRLVISHKGVTKCFNKYGHNLFEFTCYLPGAGRRQSQTEGYTVIDCILNEKTRTLFILDMLCWNGLPFLDCQADFRHSWMRSKAMECPEIFMATDENSYSFNLIPDHPADIETIRSEMWQYDSQNNVECDGLIFYHREAPYISGRTPLVTWLKPYMLPEKLFMEIPQNYEKKRPCNYVDLSTYLQSTCDKRKRYKKRYQKMEIEYIPNRD